MKGEAASLQHLKSHSAPPRVLQDYAVLYFGWAMFKIARLLFIAMLCVHLFACIYYRVKRDTTHTPDDLEAFYESKYVEHDVSTGLAGDATLCARALGQ